jgi:hypothetical protein
MKHVIEDYFWGGRCITATDLDLDGDVDILVAAQFIDKLSWWENDGDQNFFEHTIQRNYNAFWVQAIDFDYDGDIDVVGAAAEESDISWWENDGNLNFTKHTIYLGLDYPQSIYAIDLDQDGDIDVLSAARYSDELAWLENVGDRNFIKHSIEIGYGYATGVFAIDLDYDGDIDVLGTAFGENDISWWESDVMTNIDGQESNLPKQITLSQNYPNPFNLSTIVHYSLSKASDVKIAIYDIVGRKIRVLESGFIPAGSHMVTWDARGQPSGIYFYRIETDDFSEVKKMTLLK